MAPPGCFSPHNSGCSLKLKGIPLNEENTQTFSCSVSLLYVWLQSRTNHSPSHSQFLCFQ